MTQPTNGFDQVVSSHEERLQRVESTLQDVSVKLGEVGVSQKHMADSMSAHHNKIESSVEKLITKIEEHDSRIDPLEGHMADTEKRRHGRSEFLKKTAVGALLAAGGVFATKLGEIVWALITTK